MADKQEYIGYHGTNKEYSSLIVKNGFKSSQGNDEWLGHGVYFFIEGILCPKQNAREWAIN